MTVVLVHTSKNHAFIAGDSARWDWVENKNLGPVRKVHTAGTGNALAMGGSNIDRKKLAERLIELRKEGVAFPEAARQASPALFHETAEIMRSYGRNDAQNAICWYAECDESVCSVQRHVLPDDVLDIVVGFDAMGPDTQVLKQLSHQRQIEFTQADGRLPLDQWAYAVIGDAARIFPNFVSLPAIATIARPRSINIMRDDLHPTAWRGPSSAFLVSV